VVAINTADVVLFYQCSHCRVFIKGQVPEFAAGHDGVQPEGIVMVWAVGFCGYHMVFADHADVVMHYCNALPAAGDRRQYRVGNYTEDTTAHL